MSGYTNFIQDFPTRCGELLATYKHRATFQGREVTLMLSIASAGFMIPFERMRAKHPFGDKDRYIDLSNEFQALYKQKFISSDLCSGSAGRWWYGKLVSHKGMPDDWPEMQNMQLADNKTKTIDILFHLRNALAHGNIFTTGKKIQKIIFLSKKSDSDDAPFYYLAVSPDDFCIFITNWFTFITRLNLPVDASEGYLLAVNE